MKPQRAYFCVDAFTGGVPVDDPFGRRYTIDVEPASKANRRRLAVNKRTGRTMFIKSEKALTFMKRAVLAFRCQDPYRGRRPFPGPVAVFITCRYTNMRSDLDESVVLDALQGIAYVNDRQIWLRVAQRELSKTPGADVVVVGLD